MNTKIYKSLLTAGLLAGTTGLMAFEWDEEYQINEMEVLDVKLNYADLEETVLSSNELVIDMSASSWEFDDREGDNTEANNDDKSYLYWKGKVSLCHNSLLSNGLNGFNLSMVAHDDNTVKVKKADNATAAVTGRTLGDTKGVGTAPGTGKCTKDASTTSPGHALHIPLCREAYDVSVENGATHDFGNAATMPDASALRDIAAVPGTNEQRQIATRTGDVYDHLFNLDQNEPTEARLVAFSLEDAAYDEIMYNDQIFNEVKRDHALKRDLDKFQVSDQAGDVDQIFEFNHLLSEIQPMDSVKADCAELNIGISDNKIEKDGDDVASLSDERGKENAQVRLYFITTGIEIDNSTEIVEFDDLPTGDLIIFQDYDESDNPDGMENNIEGTENS